MENVLIPAIIYPEKNDASRAGRLLTRVGLGERLLHLPGQLSLGEQQRVAVVRALINEPQLILADEPTGSLDKETAHLLIQLLLELNNENGTTLILITHDMTIAEKMGRSLVLENGILNKNDINPIICK